MAINSLIRSCYVFQVAIEIYLIPLFLNSQLLFAIAGLLSFRFGVRVLCVRVYASHLLIYLN